jgi:Protein of unknown function (DUF3891)
MIVQSHPQGWEIIFQRSHGLLAAQIGFYWQKSQRPARWLETLVAIAEHDDAQEDFTGRNYITEAGAPKNFKMDAISLVQPRNITDYSYRKSRWVGLMDSMHVSFIYEPKRGMDKAMDKLLDEQHEKQKETIKALKITKKEAQTAYELVEWCDAFSLLLCQGLVQPEERKMDISRGPDGTMHQVWQRQTDDTLVVEPWCFEENEFEVTLESRVVTQLQFKDDFDLEKALKKAEIVEKTWKFKK